MEGFLCTSREHRYFTIYDHWLRHTKPICFYPHVRAFFSLFLEREGKKEGRERETLVRERSIDWLPPVHSQARDWHLYQRSYASGLGIVHIQIRGCMCPHLDQGSNHQPRDVP